MKTDSMFWEIYCKREDDCFDFHSYKQLKIPVWNLNIFLINCKWLIYSYFNQPLCHSDIFCYRFSASCLYLIKVLSLGWKEVEGSWDSMIWPQRMMEHYSLDWVRGTRGNEILCDSHAIFIRFFLDTQ